MHDGSLVWDLKPMSSSFLIIATGVSRFDCRSKRRDQPSLNELQPQLMQVGLVSHGIN
jgi:hypothetical protein